VITEGVTPSLHALCLFAGPPTGFRQRDVRAHVAALQGRSLDAYGPGALSYDLRRFRLHGLIERIPHTHRYRVTATGRVATSSQKPPGSSTDVNRMNDSSLLRTTNPPAVSSRSTIANDIS